MTRERREKRQEQLSGAAAKSHRGRHSRPTNVGAKRNVQSYPRYHLNKVGSTRGAAGKNQIRGCGGFDRCL